MDRTRQSIAEKRESTDASLGAERASANSADDRDAEKARRRADLLIERERLFADAQLRKFRESADEALARQRLAEKASRGAARPERESADEATEQERAVHDAIVERERQRSDDAVQLQRSEQPLDPTTETRRTETDRKLRAERLRVDNAVSALGTTEAALSLAEAEIGRRADVLGMVAHELRNPLSVIAVNAEFFATSGLDAEACECADEIQRSVARMKRLLDDLLDLARIEGGVFRIAKQRFDVGALLAEVHAAYGPLFTKRGLTLTCTPSAPGVVATFDHDRVIQVLSNLLTNAMKFTPSGGRVSLGMARRHDAIELFVSDSGPGIAPQALPQVFSRFWQADLASATGLGLGLYICEKIVTAHAGSIWVDSEVGRGTTFRFTLPSDPSSG